MRNRMILLAAAVLTAGCISKGEYREFVKSARAYYDEVTPVYVADVNSADLPEQSRKNRLALPEDFLRSLEAAERRAGLREDAAPEPEAEGTE